MRQCAKASLLPVVFSDRMHFSTDAADRFDVRAAGERLCDLCCHQRCFHFSSSKSAWIPIIEISTSESLLYQTDCTVPRLVLQPFSNFADGMHCKPYSSIPFCNFADGMHSGMIREAGYENRLLLGLASGRCPHIRKIRSIILWDVEENFFTYRKGTVFQFWKCHAAA